MGGGFHGNTDDGDIDMAMYTRTGVTIDDHYQWCRPGTNLGSFGFYSYTPSIPEGSPGYHEANKAAFLKQSEGAGKIISACIGTWEGFEVLLPKPSEGYFRDLHGGSYWVPPVQGGKEMGRYLKEYMDPTKSLFPWFSWLVEFHDGLKRGVDKDSDGAISTSEFMHYVRTSERVNQKWLNHSLTDDPCIVANAIIHYQHTYLVCNAARTMRATCESKDEASGEDKATCDKKNYDVFVKDYWKDGPQYISEDKPKCLDKIGSV